MIREIKTRSSSPGYRHTDKHLLDEVVGVDGVLHLSCDYGNLGLAIFVLSPEPSTC